MHLLWYLIMDQMNVIIAIFMYLCSIKYIWKNRFLLRKKVKKLCSLKFLKLLYEMKQASSTRMQDLMSLSKQKKKYK